MRVGVVSDTHGDAHAIKRVTRQLKGVQYLCHAGDHWKDGFQITSRLSVPGIAVRGNCDRWTDVPEEMLQDFLGITVLITHGHAYSVKRGYERIVQRAKEVGATLVVFGHTHVACKLEIEGVTLFNPGSPESPRGGTPPSCGIIQFERGAFSLQLVEL
ncbi:MAG: metallophosphoesterase [Bacillota bacterium]